MLSAPETINRLCAGSCLRTPASSFGTFSRTRAAKRRSSEAQGNRNPFVDNPQWVACLFEDDCGPTDLSTDPGDGDVLQQILERIEAMEQQLNDLRNEVVQLREDVP